MDLTVAEKGSFTGTGLLQTLTPSRWGTLPGSSMHEQAGVYACVTVGPGGAVLEESHKGTLPGSNAISPRM